jgi:hypothetical protein
MKSLKEQSQPLSTSDQQKATKFFDWIAQNGIQHKLAMMNFPTIGNSTPALSLCTFIHIMIKRQIFKRKYQNTPIQTANTFVNSEGRGLICKETIQCDEVVVRLPRHIVFSIESALQSNDMGPIFSHLKQNYILDDETILLLFTIHEKHNPNSFWRPYFDLLPDTLPSGLLFNEKEIQLLNGLTLCSELRTIITQLRQSYESLFPMLSNNYPQYFPSHIFSWENFVWARMIFDSRGFSFDLFKNCLLPLIDSMNTDHYPNIEARGKFNPDANAFEIRAFATIDVGKHKQRIENENEKRVLSLFVNTIFLFPFSRPHRFSSLSQLWSILKQRTSPLLWICHTK